MTSAGPTRCVIVGASIAGLTAAAAVAGRFDEVLVVERDRLIDVPEPRRGVPQSGHGHVLLVSGARALEELFPGLAEDLRAAGAVTLADLGTDMTFVRYGVRYRPMLVLPAPKTERRAGLALPVEGDRWLISMGGWHNAGHPESAEDSGRTRGASPIGRWPRWSSAPSR